MKVLFIGVFTPHSTNVSQARAFKKLGHKLYGYDYRRRRSVLGGDIQARDNELSEVIKNIKPDVTIISKGSEMGYAPIIEANKHGKTVLWYMDAMNNYNQELIDKISTCTHAIFGLRGVVEESLQYNTNSFFLDQCPDEEMNFKIEGTEKKYGKTFIGNCNASIHLDRTEYITKGGITHFNNVFGLQHNDIVNQSKINTGFSATDAMGTSVRVYKILAAGGFLMTTPWPGMEFSFEEGKHLVTFDSVENFKEKSNYYLAHDEERKKIANEGYRHTHANYMPESWAQNI